MQNLPVETNQIPLNPPLSKGELRVVACPNPFKIANETSYLVPGISLAQILKEVQPDLLLGRYAHIWVNDDYIPPEKWATTFPEAGSDIAIRVVPGKKRGGFWRTVGRVFIAIAAIVAMVVISAIMGPAGTFLGMGALFWGGMAGLAIGIVGNMALNAMFPPAQPGGGGTLGALSGMSMPSMDYGGQSSPTLSITGAQNKANLWGPVPFILGKFRVAPFYGARTYTESAGSDQYLRLLFVWGFSPVQLEDLRIADTLLENYQGVEVEHRNLTLLLSAQTIAINVTAKTLTRTTGSWLMEGIKAGNTVTLGGSTTPANNTAYLISVATALVLTFTTSTATTTEAGNGVQTAKITFGDDAITLYPVTIEETALSIELKQDIENTQASELDADELSIDIACQSLMQMNETGETGQKIVDFTVTYRETGTSGAWLTTANITMTGNTKSAVRGNLRWKPTARGQYDIKVKRTTGPDTIWTSSVSYWVALRSIKNEDPIDFPHPLAKTAMRIKATGQLNGTVEGFKGTLTSICPDWDTDTSTWITRPTQNPASLYRHVLQGIQNQKPLADSRIDLLNLRYWHEYCSLEQTWVDKDLGEHADIFGWKFNKYIDYNCTVENLLREIAAAARSSFSRIDSKVGVIIDEPQAFTIGPAFTPRNILKDSFQSNIAIVDRPHAFRCPFINEAMQYQSDERIVLADGYLIDGKDAWGVAQTVGAPFSDDQNYAVATVFEQLDLPGVTDPELIFKHARYHYAVAMLRCETVQFGTDIEWLVATRGDRIKFAHDVMLTGLSWGRVKSLVMEIIGYESVTWNFLENLLPATGSHALTWQGGGSPNYTTGLLPGNTAVILDGSHYLSLASHADFNPGTGDFTIEIIVKFNILNLNQSVFSQMDASYIGYDLDFFSHPDNLVRPSLYVGTLGGLSNYDFNSLIISDNNYHYVAVSIDRNGNAIGCLDGVFQTIAAILPESMSTAEDPKVGNGLEYGFSGNIDLVRFHKGRALSSAELAANYAALLSGVLFPDVPILSGDLGGVTTDELLPMETGKDYVLRFRLADNTSLLCPIVTAPGDPKEAAFVTPIASDQDWPAVGDLFLFGEADLEAIDLIIKSIQPNSDLSATVIAVPYDENIYLADEGIIPEHDPKITAPVEWWSPIISWIRSDGTVLFPIPGGGWQSRILVTLRRPSVLDSQITGVECQFWVTKDSTALRLSAQTIDIDVVGKTLTRAAGSWLAEGVRAGNQFGNTVILGGCTTPGNNVSYLISNVTALVLTYSASTATKTEVGNGAQTALITFGNEEAPVILPVVDLDTGEVSILPVTDGQSYDFRLRYVKKDGSRGPWGATETEVVEGKTAPPSNVTGFHVMQAENLITAIWTTIPDLDRSSYEIRYGEVSEPWATGIGVNGEYSGSMFTTTNIPPGTWDIMIKAIDTSGNYSVTEARKTLQVYQFYTVLSSLEHRPLWGGTLVNLVRNPLTGNLNPDDQDIPSGDDFDVFDNYVVNPYSDMSYTTPEIDLGADKVARAWARIYSNLGIGETGTKNPLLSLDYKLAGGAYDGFESWGIGYFEGRYVKFRVSIDPAIGLLRLTGFQPTIDQAA